MIAVFSSDIENLHSLLATYGTVTTVTVKNVTAYTMNIQSSTVLFADVGNTKVEVTYRVLTLLCKYNITQMIAIGNTASLCAVFAEIGAIAIGQASLQYDVDFSKLGDPIATIPGLDVSVFPSDTALVAAAQAAAAEALFPSAAGRIISADRFLACESEAICLRNQFLANFLDSECGAVGEIAYLTGIPSVSIKGVSNYANHCAVSDYHKNRVFANQCALATAMTLLRRQTALYEGASCPLLPPEKTQ